MDIDLGPPPPLGSRVCKQVNGVDVLIVHSEAGLFACSATCTHEQANLSDGVALGDTIECPLHGAVFSLRTGAVEFGPAELALPVYPIQVRDGRVWITYGPAQ